jgi:hypothetical protein
MLGLVPGFAGAFWDSVRFLFEIKATNLALPVPWPWLRPFNPAQFNESTRYLLTGLFFILILAFGVAAICWVSWKKFAQKPVAPALVASAFLALPYAQVAYSRAEINHLAQGIFPFLVGCLIMLSDQPAKIKWPLTTLLLVSSMWVMLPYQYGWQCLSNQQCINVTISHDTLKVDQSTASDIALLRKLADQYAPAGQAFIAAPLWPGAYALLERKSPMWEIYPLFPRQQQFQQNELARVKSAAPGFAIIFDLALDDQDALRYKNTHPLIYQYILDNFDRVEATPNPAYQIFKAKELTR